MVYYLSVDPGETSGWAQFKDGEPVNMGELKKDNFYRWLDEQRSEPYDFIVAEQYRVKPPGKGGYNHSWGEIPTIRVLGALEAFACNKGLEIHYQESSILNVAVGWFSMPHPKNKSLPMRNAVSAIAHGRYYWRKNHPNG